MQQLREEYEAKVIAQNDKLAEIKDEGEVENSNLKEEYEAKLKVLNDKLEEV